MSNANTHGKPDRNKTSKKVSIFFAALFVFKIKGKYMRYPTLKYL
jgi:hypothetical protein